MSHKVRFTILGDGPYALARGEGQDAIAVTRFGETSALSWSAIDLMKVIHQEARKVGYENIEFVYDNDRPVPPDLSPLLEDLQTRIVDATPTMGSGG